MSYGKQKNVAVQPLTLTQWVVNGTERSVATKSVNNERRGGKLIDTGDWVREQKSLKIENIAVENVLEKQEDIARRNLFDYYDLEWVDKIIKINCNKFHWFRGANSVWKNTLNEMSLFCIFTQMEYFIQTNYYEWLNVQ